MTYPCFDLVYGIRYTKKMQEILEARDSMYDELEDYGFEFLYDAGGSSEIAEFEGGAADAIGYLGIRLDGGAYWDLKPFVPCVSEEAVEEFESLRDNLPQDIKEVCPDPAIIIVWSDS